ncbi:hypothetical protein INR49_023289 [Caranx melampygus]|nr:hypothetical protein INR49_023289 [Caranx melampygus]
MSAGGQTTRSREIPAVRRIAIHDAAHMPQDYSTTPGELCSAPRLECRTSPLARTPPKLPDIPGVTRPLKPSDSALTNQPEQTAANNNINHSHHTESTGEDAQFEMDI